ncbi:MAG TPA: single-stranded DNA-binding protein [Planctomycetes bacterium]|nr:single-stranded DNA-binding protein [Planctomycetota bacterium]
MSNKFLGRGNLAAAPTLKHVEVDGEKRAVASMRIFFDRSVPDGNGGFEDKGGFWLDVSLWGPRAETAARLLDKGARVAVSGSLVQRTWEDKDSGDPRSRIELIADQVDVDLVRVDTLTYRARQNEATDEQAAANP